MPPLKKWGVHNALHHGKGSEGRWRALKYLPPLSGPAHSCLREVLDQCSPSAM